MTGSYKQIRWAEEIRGRALRQFQIMREERTRYDAIEGRNNDLCAHTWEAIETAETDLRTALYTIQDAGEIIERRAYLAPEFIIKHVTALSEQQRRMQR